MKAVVSPMSKTRDHEYDEDIKNFRRESKNKRMIRQVARDTKRQTANDDE